MSDRRVQIVMVGQHAEQNDRTGDGNRQAEHESRGETSSEGHFDGSGHESRDQNLPERAGNGDAPDCEQVLYMKMQPDAEHQQNHADFGQLVGELRIRDKAGSIGANYDAGEKIADDWRQPDTVSRVSENQG